MEAKLDAKIGIGKSHFFWSGIERMLAFFKATDLTGSTCLAVYFTIGVL